MSNRSRSLLWRLEHERAPGPSWIFGTMHVADSRAFGLLEPVKDRIRQSRAFATEFRLDALAAPQDPQALLLPDGQTLTRLLGPAHFDKLRHILRKTVGLDIHPLRRLQPLLIINMVDERLLERNMAASLDETLYRFAREEGKELQGIETYAEQLELMRRIPLSYQLKALRSLGRHIGSHRRHLLEMTRRYAQGDLRALYRSARRGASHLRKPLLLNRNAVMAARIAPMAKEQPTVFAIGAAHLDGGKGVLRLMKQAGFRVIPENPYPA